MSLDESKRRALRRIGGARVAEKGVGTCYTCGEWVWNGHLHRDVKREEGALSTHLHTVGFAEYPAAISQDP